MTDLQWLSAAVSNLALALPRLGAALLVLPLLTGDIIPPLARNIFIVSVALCAFPFVLNGAPEPPPLGASIVPIILKELFIGVVIGYAFGIVFWALEGAGQVIDAKIGTTTAQLTDPLSGHQTSLNGSFLSHFAGFVFVASGGLLVFFEVLFGSYVVWPVVATWPRLDMLGSLFFVQRFDELMRLILLLAAPALALLTLVEFGLGFINRYAERLNVFALSMSIKAWLGTFVIVLMLGNVATFLIDWFAQQRTVLDMIWPALGGG